MSSGELETTSTPRPSCACAAIFAAVAPSGAREIPLYPVCCRCGRERDDLAAFYADPPRQPRLVGEFPSIASPSVKSRSVASINGDK
jgi:hypothetical protein